MLINKRLIKTILINRRPFNDLVESPTHLIDFWSLKSFLKSLKSLEIILISMKSNDFEISYTIFASVRPLVNFNSEVQFVAPIHRYQKNSMLICKNSLQK